MGFTYGRTIFNLLGPLSSPAKVKRQVIGVFDKKWLLPFANALKNLNSTHAWIVHSEDGMDEISPFAKTKIVELNNGNIMFVWNTIVPGNDYWSTIQSKIDPMTGAVMLQQPFTTPFTYFSHKIIAVQDKPLTLTVGYTAPTSTLDDMMFFGLDTVGMFFDPTCSGITFGGSGIDYGKDILATSDGGFVLVGERNIGVGYTSVFVVKMMADCIGTGTVINDSIFVTQIEPVNDGKLQIYPNPSNGTIKLKSKEKWNKFQLFSLFGNLLEEHEIQHGGIIIESQLTEGTYLLVLTGKNDIHTEKLVIIK